MYRYPLSSSIQKFPRAVISKETRSSNSIGINLEYDLLGSKTKRARELLSRSMQEPSERQQKSIIESLFAEFLVIKEVFLSMYQSISLFVDEWIRLFLA